MSNNRFRIAKSRASKSGLRSFGVALAGCAGLLSPSLAAQTPFDANAQAAPSEQPSELRWKEQEVVFLTESAVVTRGVVDPEIPSSRTDDRSLQSSPAAIPKGRDITIIVSPYVWIPTVTGNIGLGAQGIPLDLDAGDLLEVFEFGGLIRGEIRHKSGWGISVDHVFADLGAGVDIVIGDVNADIDAGITEVAVVRRFESGADAIEAYAGIRHWNADLDIEINSFLFNGSIVTGDEWTDPIIGARYLHPISRRWRLIGQADIGGFGAGSEFSWNAVAGASYSLSERSQFQIVYRTLSVDRRSPGIGGGAPIDLDLTIQGPLIGFAYRF